MADVLEQELDLIALDEEDLEVRLALAVWFRAFSAADLLASGGSASGLGESCMLTQLGSGLLGGGMERPKQTPRSSGTSTALNSRSS